MTRDAAGGAETSSEAEERVAEADPEGRRRRTGLWLYAAHLLTIWGIALSNVCLGLTILWCGGRRRDLRRAWVEVAPLLKPLGAYAILLVVSAVAAYQPRLSLGGLKELSSLATLALGVVLVRGERDLRILFDLLTAMIALLAVHGIAQYYVTDYGDLHHRIVGLFSHYQTFAGILLLGDLLLLAQLFAGRRGRWRWAALAAVNWALLLTLTRGAWLALVCTAAVFGWICARRLLVVGLILGVAVGSLAMSRAPEPWPSRIRSIYDPRDASNYDRLCMVEAGLLMISHRPLLGIGPKMVGEYYPIYRNPTAPRFTVKHLHNAFVNLAAERGLLSLAAYLWLIGAGLRLTWRAFRREGGLEGRRADLLLATAMALAGFNFAGLFEDNWGDTEVQRLVLFFLAVPCCLDSPAAPRVPKDFRRISGASTSHPERAHHDGALRRGERMLAASDNDGGRSVPRQVPRRSELPRATVRWLRSGRPYNADVRVVLVDGGPIVVKDFADKVWWMRWLGRILIAHELRAYRKLGAAPDVPGLVGRIDRHALALELVHGIEISRVDGARPGALVVAELQRVVGRWCDQGFFHLDLRARRNVLVRCDGKVVILDLAAAIWWRPDSRTGRLVARLFRWYYSSVVLKWKVLLTPHSLTDRDHRALARGRALRRLWLFNRKGSWQRPLRTRLPKLV